MTDDLWVQRRVNDLKIGFIFLTRLPLPYQAADREGRPVAGALDRAVVGVGGRV